MIRNSYRNAENKWSVGMEKRIQDELDILKNIIVGIVPVQQHFNRAVISGMFASAPVSSF